MVRGIVFLFRILVAKSLSFNNLLQTKQNKKAGANKKREIWTPISFHSTKVMWDAAFVGPNMSFFVVVFRV